MKIIQAFRQLPRCTGNYQPLISNTLSKENMTPLKNIYQNSLIVEEKLNEMETLDRIISKLSNLGHVPVQALI